MFIDLFLDFKKILIHVFIDNNVKGEVHILGVVVDSCIKRT